MELECNFKTFQVYSSYASFSLEALAVQGISKLFKFIVH